MSVLDMTQNDLMLRLQSGRFGECGGGVPLHCYYSLFHTDPVVAPDRVVSMGQIELFDIKTLCKLIISIELNC